MFRTRGLVGAAASQLLAVAAHAGVDLSHYDLYPGDFDGDGRTDVLFIAREAGQVSGIALSDGQGFSRTLQTWSPTYLGIPWNDGQYRVVVADFNGDGRADVFLQRTSPGDHYLLLTEEGGLGGISQTLAENHAGLAWSSEDHLAAAGDFNGDGRADLFLQATRDTGLNAVFLADDAGRFTSARPHQSWNEGYAGFRWNAAQALVFAGDFNGDQRVDLLLQSRPYKVDGDPNWRFIPNGNGVLLAQSGKSLFVPQALQAWHRDGFGADWAPFSSRIVIDDFNGDGRADALLQGVEDYHASFLLLGRSQGPIFATAISLDPGQVPGASTERLIAGHFAGDRAAQLLTEGGTSLAAPRLLRVAAGGRIESTDASSLSDVIAQASSSSSTSEAADPAPFGGMQVAALSAPTSAGRTPGEFAVSAMGAATYEIPIWTPPGARDLSPQLALVYASGAPDGPMGPGWSLSGLSSITRCNKTYAANSGLPAAVTLTMSDEFCLDGNRLRLTSGTPYGGPGTQYQTEIATFGRVTAYGTAGNGPAYFIVEGKDGLKYEYGGTADSKAYTSTGSTPYGWLLSKVADRRGNNLKVTYSTTSGDIQPANIQYTQVPSKSTTYPYTVEFTYQNRVTKLSRYVAGGKIEQTKVLTKINVKSGSLSVRQYNLTYESAPTTIRDRLSSVQECAGATGTDCLRPTTIAWQNGVAGTASPTTPVASTASNTVESVDINGDGRTDLVYYSPALGTWVVQFANASGTYDAAVNTNFGSASTVMLFGDLHGDGTTQLLGNVGNVWTEARWNGSTFVITSTGIPFDTGSSNALADTDGDGRADLVSLRTNKWIYIRLNTSTATTPSFGAATQAYFWNVTGPARLLSDMHLHQGTGYAASRFLDVNGDGRQDLLGYNFVTQGEANYDQYTVFLGNGSTLSTSAAFPGGDSLVGFGRINSDNCSDLVFAYTVQISACNGTATTEVVHSGWGVLGVFDWDGDGRDDIVANQNGTMIVQRFLGSAFSAPASTGLPASIYGRYLLADSNGDGLGDLVFVSSDTGNPITHGLHQGAGTPADLVTSITDGWGINASPTYVSIAQNNYTKYSGATFPDFDFTGALYVVNQVTQSDGRGSTFNNSFWYYGARFNRQGRGFLGFAVTRTLDSRNSLYRYLIYRQDFPYIGLVDQDALIRSDTSRLVRRTQNSYGAHLLAGATCASGRCFPYLSGSTTTNYELTADAPQVQAATVTNTFDTYGNLTQSTTTTTDTDAASPYYGQAWTSVVTHTYSNNTPFWCLGKATSSTVQNAAPGQATLTRRVDHTVDTTECRYTSETLEPLSSGLQVVTTLAFDSCGNVNSTSVVGQTAGGAAMPARTTAMNYGTRCQLAESITNSLSQSASVTYDYNKGVKLSSTDPNGVTTSWLYDNFGRQTHEYRPDGTVTARSFSDCPTGPCWGVPDLRLLITEYDYDTAYSLIRQRNIFFDGLDRLRYNQGHRVLGTWTIVSYEYDALGRQVLEYNPYSSSSNGYQVFAYDLLDRRTSVALYNASGTLDRQTTAAYAGQKFTLTDAKNNVTVKWSDVTGKLRRIVDPAPGGTTNYTFDAFGNLVQSVDAIGATTTNTYNLRGFKTASTDPDAGSWTYTPNSLNELVSQTDANGKTTTFAYDLLGRLTSRLEPEYPATATTFTFGTSSAAKNIGRLQSVSKPDSYGESYLYDSLGRPQQVTYTMDASSYQVNLAYNSIGAIDTVTYPTSTSGYRFALKYLYSYGELQQVKDNASSTVFWTLNSANDSSAPLTEVLGNGALITSGYKSWTNELASRQVGNGGSSTNLQNLSYQWDLNGNLSQRQDLRQGLTEAFSNDALDRLTGSTLNGVTNLSLSYDASGNISSKSDAGAFDYTTAQAGCSYFAHTQPHAVRKAGAKVYCYDANGNMVQRDGAAISWYSYNQPNLIAFAGNSTQFSYNHTHQRWKQVAQYAAVTETTRYIGGLMEKVDRTGQPTEFRHFIPGGSNGAIYTRRSDGTASTYYVTSDHLGSGDLILDSAAAVLARESFTAFGARRGSNWQGLPSTGDYTVFQGTTRRGFTGHEMLDSVSLVHMNGRVYDPYVGRFLSPDPIIQTLGLSQALNPFSYVMNNPLALVDPTGYWSLSKAFKKIVKWVKKHFRQILAVVVAIVTYHLVGPLLSQLFLTAESTATAVLAVQAIAGSAALTAAHYVEKGGSSTKALDAGVGTPEVGFGLLPPARAGPAFGLQLMPDEYGEVISEYSWVLELLLSSLVPGYDVIILVMQAMQAMRDGNVAGARTLIVAAAITLGLTVAGGGVYSLYKLYRAYKISNKIKAASGSARTLSASATTKVPRAGLSAKEAAKDVPSWVRGERPLLNEKGRDFATRVLDAKYGAGNYGKGAGSEFSQIQKWADRAFENP
jgi:RHS repeat-associated protein